MFDRLIDKETWQDLSRMVVWFFLSIGLYAAALYIDSLQLQTLFWKVGHVSVAAHIGYWVARKSLGRVHAHSPSSDRIARAIIIGAAMIAVSQGL